VNDGDFPRTGFHGNLPFVNVPSAPHSWSVSPSQAVAIQRELSTRVVTIGAPRNVRCVAGVDVAFSADELHCVAAAVTWDVRNRIVLEQHVVRHPLRFPYVPGLLSFREAPAILEVLRRVSREPDVFLFDGQGIAHPRRFGLACHVGVILDRPSIGCAKSLLLGEHGPLHEKAGSSAALRDRGQRIGAALRTRAGVKPVYVSIGHRVSLAAATRIVLACCNGFRLPEPTRLADKIVSLARAV